MKSQEQKDRDDYLEGFASMTRHLRQMAEFPGWSPEMSLRSSRDSFGRTDPAASLILEWSRGRVDAILSGYGL